MHASVWISVCVSRSSTTQINDARGRALRSPRATQCAGIKGFDSPYSRVNIEDNSTVSDPLTQLKGEEQVEGQFKHYGTAYCEFIGDGRVRWSPPPCGMCGQGSEPITLEFSKVQRWRAGKELVQNVWPEFSGDIREWLITGTHGPCWDKMGEGVDE